MRELWIYSIMITRKHLENLFIYNNSQNPEEELNKPHNSEKLLIDHLEKFTNHLYEQIFETSSI